MSGDVHVRICESLGVKFPRATHPPSSRPDSLRKEAVDCLRGSKIVKLTIPKLKVWIGERGFYSDEGGIGKEFVIEAV